MVKKTSIFDVASHGPGTKRPHTSGKTQEGGQSPKNGGKASGWVPEIKPNHRKSLPNGRQQEPQGGGAKGAAPCCLMGGPRKVDSPKTIVEKLQDGRQKSSQSIENPYQTEDNKNPKGAARRKQ